MTQQPGGYYPPQGYPQQQPAPYGQPAPQQYGQPYPQQQPQGYGQPAPQQQPPAPVGPPMYQPPAALGVFTPPGGDGGSIHPSEYAKPDDLLGHRLIVAPIELIKDAPVDGGARRTNGCSVHIADLDTGRSYRFVPWFGGQYHDGFEPSITTPPTPLAIRLDKVAGGNGYRYTKPLPGDEAHMQAAGQWLAANPFAWAMPEQGGPPWDAEALRRFEQRQAEYAAKRGGSQGPAGQPASNGFGQQQGPPPAWAQGPAPQPAPGPVQQPAPYGTPAFGQQVAQGGYPQQYPAQQQPAPQGPPPQPAGQPVQQQPAPQQQPDPATAAAGQAAGMTPEQMAGLQATFGQMQQPGGQQ